MDSISDMIIRIKNAGLASKKSASFSFTKMKLGISEILQKEGFLSSVTQKEKKGGRKTIEVELIYDGKQPKIRGFERISKFSKRVYLKSKDIRPVKRGYGRLILSTPKGLMTDAEARKEKVGGEALFKVW